MSCPLPLSRYRPCSPTCPYAPFSAFFAGFCRSPCPPAGQPVVPACLCLGCRRRGQGRHEEGVGRLCGRDAPRPRGPHPPPAGWQHHVRCPAARPGDGECKGKGAASSQRRVSHALLPTDRLQEKMYVISHPVYTNEYVESIVPRHRTPKRLNERLGYKAVMAARWLFDKSTGYEAHKPQSPELYLKRVRSREAARRQPAAGPVLSSLPLAQNLPLPSPARSSSSSSRSRPSPASSPAPYGTSARCASCAGTRAGSTPCCRRPRTSACESSNAAGASLRPSTLGLPPLQRSCRSRLEPLTNLR